MKASPDRIELSGQQFALYTALAKKHGGLAAMYYGALSVSKQIENPDRMALAAHGLRELMEKLPRFHDLPKETKPTPMTAMVRVLTASWGHAVSKSNCHSNGIWSGEVDRALERFLKKAQEFVVWIEKERPTRKQAAARILQKLDPLSRPLPAPIEKLRVNEWDGIHDYFEGVSHHNLSTTSEEFGSWVSALEYFLLDRLIPRTFEDHAKIDEIIKEGEGNAQP